MDQYTLKILMQQFSFILPEDIEQILRLAKFKKLKAFETYIREGENVATIALLLKGIMRAYYIKDNGDDITAMIRWENQFFSSYESIVFQKPSRQIFQALEDCEMIEIDYAEVQNLMQKNNNIHQARVIIMQKIIAESIKRIEGFILLNPEERYIKLIEEKPEIISRVANKYIASYLGITPVSLSRIRKRISSRTP